MRYITVDEVKELIQNRSEAVQKIINEAIDSVNFTFYLDGNEIVMIKSIPEMSVLNKNCIGLWMKIKEKDSVIWVYAAIEDTGGPRDWLNLGTYEFESLSSIVSKAARAAGTCNECNNFVGYANIHQVSFAGKCCTACLQEAKKKYEFAGWTN